MSQQKAMDSRWPFPGYRGRLLCPVCGKSFPDVTAFTVHQFERRHWRKRAEPKRP
jgi:hypothetical protein